VSAPGQAAPLPRGRHAASRAVVEESQRGRLLGAMAAVVAEKGYARTAVADVISRAGVSRKSFYEHFANKEECFLLAYDAGVDLTLGMIEDALAAEPDPLAATLAGVQGYLRALAAHPAFARTFLIEALGAGAAALDRRAAVHARFAAQLGAAHEAARVALPTLPAVPDSRMRACVGAVDELVVEHVRVAGPEGLEALTPAVVDVVVGLLVGHETFARLQEG